ncbi:MAG: hypothetical protein HYR94_20400 [Chloroflexi bacterium]|nr:hypothetical protein [Chloroflexota bacterium]
MTENKTTRDALPETFDTFEEMAEFWDTHDVTDYEDYLAPVEVKSLQKEKTSMPEIIKAVYEGHGLVRLEQDLEGVQPQARLLVLVVPVPDDTPSVTETNGLQTLRQQLQAFETRYSLKTAEFYSRFLRGEMGDERDFIVWAGLHELLERMMPQTSP